MKPVLWYKWYIHTSPILILVAVIRSHDIWKSNAFIEIYVWKYFLSTGREESAQLCVYVGEEVGVFHHYHHQYGHHYNHNDMFDRRPRRVSSTAVPNIKKLQCNLSFNTQGLLRIQLKLNTALLSTVRSFVCHSRRDISHFSHIKRHKCHVNHQGAHQTLYILNQNHPGYLSSKDQTRQDHLLRPDQPDHWFWL